MQRGIKYPRMGNPHPAIRMKGRIHQNRSCRIVRFLIAFARGFIVSLLFVY
jgi:hypothetical protein